MNSKLTKSLQRLPELVIYGMALVVVILISFLFPEQIKFKYEFEQDQTWRYEDLYAFDRFPIKKPQAEIDLADSTSTILYSDFNLLITT